MDGRSSKARMVSSYKIDRSLGHRGVVFSYYVKFDGAVPRPVHMVTPDGFDSSRE
jgi:hypothetical protein